MTRIIQQERSIIIACDVAGLDPLRSLVAATHEAECVGGYKLGFSLGLRYGLPRLVSAIREYTQKPVIYDHQKAGTDVPHTAPLFADVMAASGVDYAILFPFSSPSTERAWIDALKGRGVTPIVGALMTTPDFLSDAGGFFSKEIVSRILRIASESGVENFVLPANKPELTLELRLMVESQVRDPVFFLPGVGAQGGEISRIRQVLGRRWHGIVGRSVYASPDPAASVSRLAEELCG